MSKKRIEEKRQKQHKKTRLYAVIGSIVLVVVVGFFLFAWMNQVSLDKNLKLWYIDSSGKLNFSDRGPVNGRVLSTESATNYTLQKIVYESFGDNVFALLRVPKNVTKPPVVVVMPAASITKEADEATAVALCNMGYASLTLDARGIGDTGGDAQNDWATGFGKFESGGDPAQYKQVYDALKGLDYVKSRSDLDGNNVSILGESIGGMWAIVAAGIEPSFKGVITISASDFDFNDTSDANATRFINAVMPSKYLDSLTPRKIAMFQFDDDSVTLMADGKALYDKAIEPRSWHQYNGSVHGLWSPVIADDVHQELIGMLGR